jgi:hypothetical protein
MSQQKTTRLYWKDALRQVQISLDDETAVGLQHKWATAFHQAQADLKDPSAIVWLPDEIADVIQDHPAQEPPPAQTRRQRLKALLLALFLLIPAAISYLLAYRRITAPLR